MSNFLCIVCGAQIMEGEGGRYVTGCIHYPLMTPGSLTVEEMKDALRENDPDFDAGYELATKEFEEEVNQAVADGRIVYPEVMGRKWLSQECLYYTGRCSCEGEECVCIP